MKKIITSITLILAIAAVVVATEETVKEKGSAKASATAEHKFVAPSELQWADAPPGLPPGARMAVLDGNPNEKGSFTVRLQMPDGYKIPPHTHPSTERVTVISGTFHLGMGDKLDEAAAHQMAVGSFAVLPAGMEHFAWSSGESVVQIHSEGPFKIKYVNTADDPRNAKK
jgi:quercetin dioxygenase-like cupin family protein